MVTAEVGGGVGGLLEVGAEGTDGVEVVFCELRVALGVVEGDVLAEGAVEVGGRGLLLVDREHHVDRRRRHRRKRKWKINVGDRN